MRQPIDYIIVYRDTCSRTYGQGACNAQLSVTGNQKCFNTMATCQVADKFARAEHKDVFINPTNLDRPANQIKLHDGSKYNTIYPFLLSVSHTPATVNPAGVSGSSSPLGTRATLSCNLTDAASNDFYQDKYFIQRISGEAVERVGGYNPDEKGSFFTKYFSRNAYLVNRKIEWVTGELVNGEVKNWVKRVFFIKDIADPNSRGTVAISAHDALGLTNVKNAQAPTPSGVALGVGINSSARTIQFDTNAPDFKPWSRDKNGRIYARINDEIVRFNWSSGQTTVSNSVERGLMGTQAAEHAQLDGIQPCWVIDAKTPADILEQLILSFTSIPASFLDKTQWNSQINANPHLNPQYGLVVISDPKGVDELLGDMAEQMQFYPYFNEGVGKIHIAPVTPEQNPDLVIESLTEMQHFIEDSLQLKKKQSEVTTRVYMYNRVRNWAEDLKDPKNYFTNDVFTNLIEEDDNHQRQGQAKTLCCYWLGGFSLVEPLGMRLAENFAKPPLEYSFSLDTKDSHLKVTDFVNISSRLLTNFYGETLRVISQITQIKGNKNTTLDLKAVSYNYTDTATGADPKPVLVYLEPDGTGQMATVRTSDEFFSTIGASPHWDLISEIKFIVRSGIVMGGKNTDSYALIHDLKLPAEYTGEKPVLEIDTGAIISGAAGAGGNGTKGRNGEAGKKGGDAIKIEQPIAILNNGIIGGGGGGGGGGGAAKSKSRYKSRWANSGGGGAGAGYVGAKGGVRGRGGSRSRNGTDGGDTVDIFTGGNGGSGASYKGARSGKGGKGGDLGQAGEKGQNAISGSKGRWSGGAGGIAGRAIVGINNVEFITEGDIRGLKV